MANNLSTDEEHFLLLQVIEDYLNRRYSEADAESMLCIHSLLSHWIQKLSALPDQPVFLVNKMAHIFSLVFATDFPDRWPTFMDDLFLSQGLDSVPIVIFYLKTLLAIDSEVVDRDIQRDKLSFDRNTKIKDFMRELCIPQIVKSWWTILERCSDVTAQCLCLDAIAAFVDWINVELIANDLFVQLVISRLGKKELSEVRVYLLFSTPKKHRLNVIFKNSDYDDVSRAGSLLSAIGSVLIDTVFTRIVSICFRRYVVSEELDVDGSGEDEIEFAEYRKELRGILNTIGTMRPDLIVSPLESLVAEVSASAGGTAMPIARLEAIVQLVHGLVEIIPANFVNAKEGWMGRGAQLPVNLLNSMQLDGRSASVHVLYFEVACRYERLLMTRPQPVIPQIAAAFLDERGITFPVARVRTRIVYLFCRFVKAHKTALSPLVSEVIARLAPLLVMSSRSDQLLTADDQAFIFEATGTLIVFGELGVEQKSTYIGELANKLAERFLAATRELQMVRVSEDATKIQMVQQFMANTVGYCSRLSKAFNNSYSMQSCRCVDMYMKLLNLFLGHLTPENAFLLESVRQLAHRLVVCLDSELLPVLPALLSALVSIDLDSMNHLLILSHQIVAKFKVSFQILYIIDDILSGDFFDSLQEAATRFALSSDQPCQKLALATLSRTSVGNTQWWQRTLRTALEVPSLSHISASDAGISHLQVVHEVASTLLTLQKAHPEEFAVAVKSLMPGELGLNLLSALENFKSRALDEQLLIIYEKIRKAQQLI
ncbi:unnamed protein product [Angiostrongylus costaricensis]|uniref:Exportin-T n=1 Tax=Angiostrongylus costaricensis TaxID=334426 RepID=A0A158PLW0_ANGCS|nr:unnamed protein product [Angiostrongylus costaricensis]